jgi:xanthine dehydrogenase small subunit
MADTIRFLLNQTEQRVRDIAPSTTVLQWLRARADRRGTKQGCAEGDCGACTVIVGTLHGGGVSYRAINACIQPLPSLHGKVLLTVEDLAAPDGTLHPVQQAMVTTHASQCGFCTPGVVMSLVALWLSHDTDPGDTVVSDALVGNLCRCTGYRPILDAARLAFRLERPGDWTDRADRDRAVLAGLGEPTDLDITVGENRYLAPITVNKLVKARADHPDATIIAGATDVGLWITKQRRQMPVLISTMAIDALRRTVVEADQVTLGAGLTYTDAAPTIKRYFPALASLYTRFASLQVRNAGTIGGNVANGSPIGDSMPMLLALDASVELASVRGRRTLPLTDFYLGYQQNAMATDEVVTALKIPRHGAEWLLAGEKISKRFDQDISAVCGGFAIRFDADGIVQEARLGFGGMAAIPARASKLEAALVGQRWSEDSVQAALPALAEDFTPIDDMRASAQYRLRVAGNLLRRFALTTTASDYPAGGICAHAR